MKDILGIQYKDVDKQQLLSIGSISNYHFMKVFHIYGDQSENISVLTIKISQLLVSAVGPSSSYKNIKA